MHRTYILPSLLLLLFAFVVPAAFGQPMQNSPQTAVSGEPLSFEEFVRRRRMIEQDLVEQQQLLMERQRELAEWNTAARQRFYDAYGTTAPEARDQVLNMVDQTLAQSFRMNASDFEQGSDPSSVAYVYPNDSSRIYMQDGYYEEASYHPAVRPSHSGILSHEMSHFSRVGGTQDRFEGREYYGLQAAENLARDRATGRTSIDTTRSANTFGYYVDGVMQANPVPQEHAAPSDGPFLNERGSESIPQHLMRAGNTAAVTLRTSEPGNSDTNGDPSMSPSGRRYAEDSSRLTFDEDTLRVGSSPASEGQPAVTRRTPGTAAATAGFRFP